MVRYFGTPIVLAADPGASNQATTKNYVDTQVATRAATASPTFTGTVTTPRLIVPPVTLTYAATLNTDASLSDHFRVTLTGNVTLANPTNGVDGQKVIWEFIQDTTGGRTLSLGTAFTFGSDITASNVVLTTTSSKRDFLGAMYNSSLSLWHVISIAHGY